MVTASIPAEQAVLGGLMLDNSTLGAVVDRITAEDFSRSDHKVIFRAITGLAGRGEPFDAITIAEELDHEDNLEEGGGLEYIARLPRETPTTVNIRSHADIVREHSRVRKAKEIAALISKAYDSTEIAGAVDQLVAITKITDTAPAGPPPYTYQSLDEIVATSMTSNVQGLSLAGGTVAIFSGPPNVSKTTLANDLGVSMSGGADQWFGLKIQNGPVAYVAAEAPASVLSRARAAAKAKFSSKRVAFYLLACTPALGSESQSAHDTDRLIETINAIGSAEGEVVRIVFIDTLAACLGGGDENSTGMITLVGAAQRIALTTGACVVLLHHPSKAGDGKGLRGHGSLLGAVDTVVEIATDVTTGLRTATLTKSRDTAMGLQLHYRLEVETLPEVDQWGDPITTVIIRPEHHDVPIDTPTLKGLGANQKKSMTALKEWARTHQGSDHIRSDDIQGLLKAQGLGRQRQPEALDFLTRVRVITPSIGGYTIDRGML